MLYGDWIGRWAETHPGAEALVDATKNRRYTYRELRDQVYRMSNFLKTVGTKKGDRIAVLAINRAEYIILGLATGRLGAILVPLNCRLAESEFYWYLEDSKPAVLFHDTTNSLVASALTLKTGIHRICFNQCGWENSSADCPASVPVSAEDPQLIIYTSGTTGIPKGVILTHGMITWNSINTNIGWALQRGDRTILHAPLFYTGGWNVFTLPLFHSCGTNVLIEKFDPDIILDLIERERITVLFAIPTMFQMMLDSSKFDSANLTSIRFMVSGGAPLTEQIFEQFENRKHIHLWEGYGLTEAGPNNFMANGKLKTVGHPMPHVDIKLINVQGEQIPSGQEGELLLRGDNICGGYWNKPEAIAEVFKDGWFHTGDIAKIDEDGHVSIVGRKKDMFISGGINIYPAEIERVLNTHPQIASAAVIGVPDQKWGEVGKAIIELKTGRGLTIEDLREFMKSRIAKYKIPRYVAVVDALPRTATSSKIQKYILKENHGNADNN
jgi:fatty-acyl-CoA synthase